MAGFRGYMQASQRYGGRTNRVFQMLKELETRKGEKDGVYTTEPCVVYEYHPAEQRVDVVLKNFPKAPVIRNVPIAGAGGELRTIRPMLSLKAGDPDPTVGIIAFTRSDSRTSWKRRRRSDPFTDLMHRPVSPVFIDTVLLEDEAPYHPDYSENASVLNQLEPGDAAMVHSSGSRIIFKANGDLLLLAAGDIYTGPAEVDASTFPAAARQGDAGDGTGGSIAGGSGRVKIG